MAYGDLGGAITELIVTCKTPSTGTVAIAKGDAVKLTGAYTVTNATAAEDTVFGQALAPATANDTAIPIKIRGVCLFAYTGDAPSVDGAAGVVASATDGKVKAADTGVEKGVNLKVDTTNAIVHVLL